MVFKSKKHLENEYTKARLQGYSKSIFDYCLEKCMEKNQRCKVAEKVIIREPEKAVQYAYLVINGPWPEAENIIFSHDYSKWLYEYHRLQRKLKCVYEKL